MNLVYLHAAVDVLANLVVRQFVSTNAVQRSAIVLQDELRSVAAHVSQATLDLGQLCLHLQRGQVLIGVHICNPRLLVTDAVQLIRLQVQLRVHVA